MEGGKKYARPADFRKALEERLKNISRTEGVDIMRLRRQLAFDRLLARLFHDSQSPWLLKGGYAMELRITQARTTRDLDLGMKAPPRGDLIDMIQEQASLDLSDFFSFIIGRSMMNLSAPPYGGERYPVEARMEGRTFIRFHLDIGIGDEWLEPCENLNGRDWLAFAGLAPPEIRVTSSHQQFAEKFHAYTMPRESFNSRVKDFVDMLLLIQLGRLDKVLALQAIQKTFMQRKTHEVPGRVPFPPKEWEVPFRALAEQSGLDGDLNAAFVILSNFLIN